MEKQRWGLCVLVLVTIECSYCFWTLIKVIVFIEYWYFFCCLLRSALNIVAGKIKSWCNHFIGDVHEKQRQQKQ